MKVVIAEPVSSFLSELIKNNNTGWTVYDTSPDDKKELISRLKGADAASSYSIKYDKEIFEACPRLKFLAIPAVGANFFVNMEDAKEFGVTVMNCPGYNSVAVAEMAIGSALAISRMVPLLQKDLRSGIWDESSHGKSVLISSKKIGIVGRGNVAKAIEQRLAGWNVEISFIDSRSSSGYIDEVIKNSEVVFVCVPANESTEGLISKKRIMSMKTSAIFVNVGRGAVVDEDALYDALKNMKIFGAALDVFVEEPEYGEPVPKSIKRFIELDNVYVTPHLAGSSKESSDVLGQMIFDNLVSATNNKPTNIY